MGFELFQTVGIKKYRGDRVNYIGMVIKIKKTINDSVYIYVYNPKTHIYEFWKEDQLENVLT